MEARVIFHVGYMKTGSTTLQLNLFNAVDSIEYLSGNAGGKTDLQRDERSRLFVEYLSNKEHGSAGKAVDLWHSFIAPSISPTKLNVISEEDLIVDSDSPRELFDRIYSLRPSADILIVVRKQEDVVRSIYDMYPTTSVDRSGYRAVPVDSYLDWAFGEKSGRFSRLKYGETIQAALDVFPRERVHVFSFGQLFKNEQCDLGRLASVLSLQEDEVRAAINGKPARNEFQIHMARRKMRRLLGPIHGSWFLPLPALRAINRGVGKIFRLRRTEFSREQIERIQAYYADDNDKFRRLFPEIVEL